jgi:uncharacterized protein (TIGR03083 family)
VSKQGVEGLRAERDSSLEIFRSLTDDEWNAPSDCAGWTVRDVVAHMGSIQHGVADPSAMVDISGGAELAMEVPVAERRNWKITDVLEEYETYSGQIADATATFQDPPLADTMLPMADLGTHPMAIMSNMFLFDVYCHLRNDILGPHGPIDRPEPPRDEARLRPTVEWMLAGLPWMAADTLGAVLDRAITLELTGTGGGVWTISPVDDESEGRVRVREGEAPGAEATVTSSAHDFVVWGTRRRPWSNFVQTSGDPEYATRVLDAVKIF